jgi:phage shock protein A
LTYREHVAFLPEKLSDQRMPTAAELRDEMRSTIAALTEEIKALQGELTAIKGRLTHENVQGALATIFQQLCWTWEDVDNEHEELDAITTAIISHVLGEQT